MKTILFFTKASDQTSKDLLAAECPLSAGMDSDLRVSEIQKGPLKRPRVYDITFRASDSRSLPSHRGNL